ncbi:hypothetical protein KIW84_020364 [Lathyrus oleraceus]|uniref:TIR domain-containing protein n=1 Tax=Pisum sativum TaxID=3888 RepID=A0A9D4Y6X7_PEA|nr:hypothetical protein KIW84_020364 [Pisum sativum]
MAGNINYSVLRMAVPMFGRAIRMVYQEVNENKYVSNWIGEVFKDVETEKKRLISNRDLVRVRLEATDHKTDMVSDDVFLWLKEADILIPEVENLTLQVRRRQWNEFRKLLKKITTLNMKCDFQPFSIPIPSLEHFSSGNIVSFKSREKASDQLLVALQDDNSSIIGLYGRQGSGKTTLVKAMGEKVKFLKMFSKVVFATVSQNLNIRTMQEEIADSLDIRFDKNSEAGRARRIFSTIESMIRPILVIFDDVQVKFDPEDVGVPCKSNRCKILVTARCQQECDLMYCQRDVQLDPLSKEEAWILFEKHSGIHDEDCSSSPDLSNVAREVAFECEGVPRLIKDVASSLRNKPIDEWKASLDSLKHSMAKWKIFLSFRGEDTRYAFTGSLYQSLCQGGFKTFMDDGGLQTGDQTSPSLLNVIEASRLSIIVLSENYANSTRCLDELVKILECKKLKKQLVWPIFYKVEPSDIRNMRKCYGKDMARHENIFGVDSERVQKWKSALGEVCNLSGMAYSIGYEYEFIQKIVEHANDIRSRLQIRNI